MYCKSQKATKSGKVTQVLIIGGCDALLVTKLTSHKTGDLPGTSVISYHILFT